MKNILVPTDFSHCAFEALQVAAKLAQQTKAVLHLTHVYDKPLTGISLDVKVDVQALKMMRVEIEEEMDRLVNIDFLEGVEVVKHYIPEKTVWQLLDMNLFENVDLIVMGTHGASGFKEFFLGSNTQKMIQMSPAPVLAIKDYLDPETIKNVVFASDFLIENIENFDNLKSIVELLDAKVHLLNVVTPTNFVATEYSLELMRDFSIAVGLEDATMETFNALSVEAGVIAYARMVNADLIAMETHGRTGIAHFFNGSIAEQISNHLSLPFLTMRIKQESPQLGVVLPSMR